MSLYAVKNDKGEWWDFEAYDGFWSDDSCECAVTAYKERADSVIKEHGGHVVELVEAPAKVVVSGKESEILKKLDCEIRTKSTGYSPWKWLSKLDDLGMAVEDAYKALALGWTVEKPKRYVLPMPYGADDDDPDYSPYAAVNREYHAGPAWYQGPCVSFKKAREHYSVTQADIDAAPDWVKAIKPVEVTEDEQ